MRILIINPGSTSTKIAVYDHERLMFRENINHSSEELSKFNSIVSQFEMRKEAIISMLEKNNSNINSFTSSSLTLKPGDVWIYNGTSGLSNLSITVNTDSNPNPLLGHYKIIVKTGSSTSSTFLTANYTIMLPPSCSQKLDANSIYEIDLELVRVAGEYKLLTVISKFV